MEKLEFGGDISDFGATNARIYTEHINGNLDCRVLHYDVKQFLGKMAFEQDLTRCHASNTVKEKIVKLKVRVLD